MSLKLINMKNLKKAFFDQFPMLRDLAINKCEIECIEYNAFSKLKNLQKLNLSGNKLKNFDPNYNGLRESTEFCIENNYPMLIFRLASERNSEFYD